MNLSYFITLYFPLERGGNSAGSQQDGGSKYLQKQGSSLPEVLVKNTTTGLKFFFEHLSPGPFLKENRYFKKIQMSEKKKTYKAQFSGSNIFVIFVLNS